MIPQLSEFPSREICPPGYESPRFNWIRSTGQSVESKEIAHASEEYAIHFFSPISRQFQSPEKRFRKLLFEWQESVQFLSDTDAISMHPAYQQIIGMGPAILPLIFSELRGEATSGIWFWALKAITAQDPVPHDHKGRVKMMTEDWLRWAARNGY